MRFLQKEYVERIFYKSPLCYKIKIIIDIKFGQHIKEKVSVVAWVDYTFVEY